MLCEQPIDRERDWENRAHVIHLKCIRQIIQVRVNRISFKELVRYLIGNAPFVKPPMEMCGWTRAERSGKKEKPSRNGAETSTAKR